MSRLDWLRIVGKKIRSVREAAGMSQEQAAYEVKLARSYYGGVERGERNISAINLIKIAKVFGCEVGDLFPRSKVFK